jgi:chaperonin GroES
MAANLRPLHDRVAVRRIAEGEQAPGGIIIPDTARERPQEGEVVAVCEGKYRIDCVRQSLDVARAIACYSLSTEDPRSSSMAKSC